MAKRKRQSRQGSLMRQLITHYDSRAPVSEQYRTIRTNLQFSSVDEDLKSLMITSAGPDEGKTLTTSNLAITYAQLGKSVLLIDADMRKPTLHYTFQMDNLAGLSNILVGDTSFAEVSHPTLVDGLDVISCGPIPPNPTELLGSMRMQQFLLQAQDMYDMVLFDTPPFMAVADAKILAGICDGIVLVVRSKVTEYESAQKAKETLEGSHAKLLGTVLNGRSKKESNYYYYYGNQ